MLHRLVVLNMCSASVPIHLKSPRKAKWIYQSSRRFHDYPAGRRQAHMWTVSGKITLNSPQPFQMNVFTKSRRYFERVANRLISSRKGCLTLPSATLKLRRGLKIPSLNTYRENVVPRSSSIQARWYRLYSRTHICWNHKSQLSAFMQIIWQGKHRQHSFRVRNGHQSCVTAYQFLVDVLYVRSRRAIWRNLDPTSSLRVFCLPRKVTVSSS